MTQNGVSVVTTTWNERLTIGNLILRVRAVLRGFPHEIIVVDDESPDGTIDVARPLADVAVSKKREGQTMGLLHGMRLAKYRVIITIDSDLESSPEHIPELLSKTNEYDVVVASRRTIPASQKKSHPKPWANCSASQIPSQTTAPTKKTSFQSLTLKAEKPSEPNSSSSPRKTS